MNKVDELILLIQKYRDAEIREALNTSRAAADECRKTWSELRTALTGAVLEWLPVDSAPYGTRVLAWLHLPKNPIASACVVAERCFVEKDDPESYAAHIRQTVGCWWANGMYYPAGHVTHWQPLPTPPSEG